MGKADFVQEGLSINYTPATAVAAGDIVDLGELVGVAKVPIEANALGALSVEGVFGVVKSGSAGPVFAVGEPVFWDTVNQLAVRTGASGCILLGVCVAAAGASDTSVRARLRPHGIPAAFHGLIWEDVDISSASKVLDKEDLGKVMNVTVGHATNVVTLPATYAGARYVVRCGANGQRVALSPAAADKVMGPDLAGVDNKDRILAAATSRQGDFVVLGGDGVDGYYINAQRGVWSNEP